MYYKKKYRFEINLISNKELIIPEYTIELLNKKKKLVKKIEHIEDMDKKFKENNNKFKLIRPNLYENKNYGSKNKNKKNYKFKKRFNYRKKHKKHLWMNRNSVQ